MELRKKIKKDALVSLRNSWGKAIAILLFICGVYLLFLLLEQLFGSLLHIDFLSGGGRLDLYRGTLEVGTPSAMDQRNGICGRWAATRRPFPPFLTAFTASGVFSVRCC